MATLGPNLEYEKIGHAFVSRFYQVFDAPETRGSIASLYHPTAMMTFENNQVVGQEKIMALINGLSFKNIQHVLTKVDCQPTQDGGVIILVTGRLKTDEDPPHPFSQTFLLKPECGSFFICHDIFRLSIHDTL